MGTEASDYFPQKDQSVVAKSPVYSAYIYEDLANEDDIRLITLLPGDPDDKIQLRMSCIRLPHDVPSARSTNRIPIDELKKTLPANWCVYQTIDNRALFYYEEEGGSNWVASWDHPVPGFDGSLYSSRELDTKPSYGPFQYEALSYTWGLATHHDMAFIYHPRRTAPAILSLSQNLTVALRQLRYPDRPRTLWVDAICINQANGPEKARQLTRMPQIYGNADRVVVWLGPEEPDSRLAMDTLDFLGRQLEVTTDNWIFCTPGAEYPYWCEASCVFPYDDKIWSAIGSLLNREWFSRVWIVQEIQLANSQATMQCGGSEVPWIVFRRAINCLWNKNNLPISVPRVRLAFVEHLATFELTQAPISYIIRRTEGRICADPRDRVYGLLGLFSSAFSRMIRPSYSLGVEDVYRDLIIKHIRHVKRLELLRDCHTGTTTSHLGEWPSWVPDYSIPNARLNHVERQFSAGQSECCTKLLEANVLEVIGVRCAEVSYVAPVAVLKTVFHEDQNTCSQDMISTQFEQRFTKVPLLHGPIEQNYVTGEILRDAIAKILTGNYLRERFPDNSVPTLNDWISRLYRDDLASRLINGTPQNEGAVSFQEDYAISVMKNRLYFETREGYIGLGPPGVKPESGDTVCVLLGCDSPMVLREQHTSGRFTIIGESYVCGLEDVRALLGPLERQWRARVHFDSIARPIASSFLNLETGEVLEDDPRLPELSDEWEVIPWERTADDPVTFRAFKNKTTGSIVKSDPRLTPEALKSRGVPLEPFALI
ncbi:hypothetical protein AAE478_008000 [Parahypoxylon ruwenzoriense]